MNRPQRRIHLMWVTKSEKLMVLRTREYVKQRRIMMQNPLYPQAKAAARAILKIHDLT
jgi:hypothetical protein